MSTMFLWFKKFKVPGVLLFDFWFFFFQMWLLHPKPFSFRSSSPLLHASSVSNIISQVLRWLFLDFEGKLKVVFPLALFLLLVALPNLYLYPALTLRVGFAFSLLWGCCFKAFFFFFFLMRGNSFAQLAACPSILLQKELSKCFILQTWNILEFSLPMLACGRTCFGQRSFMETSQIWKTLSCEWIFFFLIKTSERKGKAHKGAVCACEQLCCRHQ